MTIAIGTAAIIIGGGAAVIAISSGGTSAQAGLADSAAQPGQSVPDSKAELNTVLSSADSPTAADLAAAAPTPAGAQPGRRPAARVCRRLARRLRATRHPRAAHRVRAVCRPGRARLRPLVRGIHGQFTYQTSHGVRTLAFERGTIKQVAGTAVTVTAPDGTTWTWHVVGDTVVRQDRAKVGPASLAAGQRVFIGGPVVSGADDARLIVIRPAASAHPDAPAAPDASASAPAPVS